jgi:hypothetical protein
MPRPGALIFVIAALFIGAVSAGAETEPPTAAGYWQGPIDMPFGPLEVRVELSRSDSGWSGQIDIPAQGVHDFALGDIAEEEGEVRFAMKNVHGDPRFVGRLSEDGQKIAGVFHHVSRSFPFTLDRSQTPFPDDTEELKKYLEPGQPGEGLEGLWLGVIQVGLSRLRLDLEIVQAENGSLGGTISSPDQKTLDMPIEGITFVENKLDFQVPSIFGKFEGFLVDDGAALVGKWSQSMQVLPLTFRRQAPSDEPGTSLDPAE